MTTRLADGTIGDSIDLYYQKTQSLFLAWQNGEATQKQVIDSIVADIANCTSQQEMEANTRKLQQALVPLGKKIVERPTWCCCLWWPLLRQ